MQNIEAEKLLEKYQDGKCTPEEAAIVEATCDAQVAQHPVDLSQQELDKVAANTWSRILERTRRTRNFSPFIYAAAILLPLGISLYFLNQRGTAERAHNTEMVLEDVAPGGNKAILILADGKRVDVGDQSGAIGTQGGSAVSKADDSTLVYLPSNEKQLSENVYNTLVTPRGGQFTIRLPDGSRVWLNAASQLKYPASFGSMKARRVELSGEAYFEIAKDQARPFIVVTPTQQVHVLGTHFNVNSYRDEQAVVTTLLEGSVSILSPNSSPKTLIPGQQAKQQNGTIEILPAVDNALAWKEGKISLDGDLQRIMRQVGRWYDVEVVYEGSISGKRYAGAVYRNTSLAQLLEILKTSGNLDFKIGQTESGVKKLIVKSKN